MGLFSLMSRKKPVSSGSLSSQGKYNLNSNDRITPREMPRIQRRLVHALGHRKAEDVMEQLEANMDTDGRFGGRDVNSKEIDNALKTLEKSRYNNIDSGDLKTAREILEEYK